eukprot:g5647.t1
MPVDPVLLVIIPTLFILFVVFVKAVATVLSMVLETAALALWHSVEPTDDDESAFSKLAAVMFLALAVPAMHVLVGPRRHQGYRRYAPFCGTPSFVALQAGAWGLYGLLLLAIIVLSLRLSPHWGYVGMSGMAALRASGALLALAGTLGLGAGLLLLASFGPSMRSVARPAGERERPGTATGMPGLSWTNVCVMGLFCTAVSVVHTITLHAHSRGRAAKHGEVVGDDATESTSGAELIVASLFVLVVPATQFAGGTLKHAHARTRTNWFWQPFAGGNRFVLLQAIAWSVYSAGTCICAAALLVHYERRRGAHPSAATAWKLQPRALLSLLGALGFVAESLVVWSLLVFDPKAGRRPPSGRIVGRAMRAVAWESAAVAGLLLAAVPLVIVSALSTGVVDLALSFCDRALLGSWRFFEVCSAIVVVDARAVRFAVSRGAATISLAAAPLTQVFVGRRRFVSAGFMLWQPFAGGARFVMLQAAAWTLYGTAIALAAFGGAATGTAGDSAAAGASVSDTAVTFGFVAELLVLLSLSFFEPDASRRVRANARRHRQAQTHSVTRTTGVCAFSSRWEDVCVVAFVLAGMPLLVSVCGDVVAALGPAFAPIAKPDALQDGVFVGAAVVAAMLSLSAVPLTQLVVAPRMHPDIVWVSWAPFQGGTRFVALQAAGWALFGLSVAAYMPLALRMVYEALCEQYYAQVREIFERHKDACGDAGTVLEFV